MNSSVSVSQLCNRSTNLHICGYSEEVLDNLIQNGDLKGYFSTNRGEMLVEIAAVHDFLPFERESQPLWEREQSERDGGFFTSEGLL